MQPSRSWALAARLGPVVGLAAYSVYFLTARMMDLGDCAYFTHRVHLVFHEAGHIFLLWAPPVWHAFGGTLGQLLVPLTLVVAVAAKNRDGYAAAICAWWLGNSLVDVAPYINDARMMQLTLLGGSTGMEVEGHDWNFILEHMGWLTYDIRLARAVLMGGRIVMVVALAVAVGFAIRTFIANAPSEVRE